jgi:hypothetical protein
MPVIEVFVSHSNKDALVARAFLELLTTALTVAPDRIRCTAVDGYRLPLGAVTDQHLREEILAASALVALLSSASIESPYVLFELGARWGAGKPLFPLLVGGARPELLRGPLVALNALRCDSHADVHQIVLDIGHALGRNPISPAAYHRQLENFIAVNGEPDQQSFAQQVINRFVPALEGLRDEIHYETLCTREAVSQLASIAKRLFNQFSATTREMERETSVTRQGMVNRIINLTNEFHNEVVDRLTELSKKCPSPEVQKELEYTKALVEDIGLKFSRAPEEEPYLAAYLSAFQENLAKGNIEECCHDSRDIRSELVRLSVSGGCDSKHVRRAFDLLERAANTLPSIAKTDLEKVYVSNIKLRLKMLRSTAFRR